MELLRFSGFSRWCRFDRSDMQLLHVPRRPGLPALVVYALKYVVVCGIAILHTLQVFLVTLGAAIRGMIRGSPHELCDPAHSIAQTGAIFFNLIKCLGLCVGLNSR